MLGASFVPHRSVSPQPYTGRARDRDVVPVAQAAGLIRNFLSAIEAEGGPNSPFMTLAKALAERQLAHWVEANGREGGAA